MTDSIFKNETPTFMKMENSKNIENKRSRMEKARERKIVTVTLNGNCL